MDTFTRHKIKIARDTLRLSDAGAIILGGMTKQEARDFLASEGWPRSYIAKIEKEG